MKLSSLLQRRDVLLRQARLANLAFAYQRLSDFAERITRARLSGTVSLKPAAPDTERYCATLTALEGNQSVIEEHFTDGDLMDLADIVAFTSGLPDAELTFRLENFPGKFLAGLRLELEQGGVVIDHGPQLAEPTCDGQAGCSQGEPAG